MAHFLPDGHPRCYSVCPQLLTNTCLTNTCLTNTCLTNTCLTTMHLSRELWRTPTKSPARWQPPGGSPASTQPLPRPPSMTMRVSVLGMALHFLDTGHEGAEQEPAKNVLGTRRSSAVSLRDAGA